MTVDRHQLLLERVLVRDRVRDLVVERRFRDVAEVLRQLLGEGVDDRDRARARGLHRADGDRADLDVDDRVDLLDQLRGVSLVAELRGRAPGDDTDREEHRVLREVHLVVVLERVREQHRGRAVAVGRRVRA